MYFRGKNNKIIDLNNYDIVREYPDGLLLKDKGTDYADVQNRHYLDRKSVAKQGEKVEDLIMVGDLIQKTNKELFIIPNEYAINFYIKKKLIDKIWLKQGEDYILLIYSDEKGCLHLRKEK